MKGMIVSCDCCGKDLFETRQENAGRIAGEATHRGFVVKMPVYYGCYDFKVFCDDACKERWFKDNFSEEQLAEGRKKGEELRKRIQSKEFQDEVTKGLARIQKFVKKLQDNGRRKY